MSGTETISFYSFKGGTGRSTALANVAHELAERGLDVGCMDLDLAAPGLHMIFPNLGPAHADQNTIHDYLKGKELHNIENYIIDVGERIGKTVHDAPDGNLVLLAGDVKPPGGDPKETMMKSLELKNDFIERRDLDYLLIDSRSGLSNHMAPVFDEADRLLAFHRWTHQHKLGTVELGKWLENIPLDMDIDHMMSIASNVPEAVDEADIETWVANSLYVRDVANFTNYHIINSSDTLREGEAVVALENPDDPVVEQFRTLSDWIADPERAV